MLCAAVRRIVIAQQIASFGLDVLVYPDVGMTTMSFVLALQRLAPVQVRTCPTAHLLPCDC